ncbi:hypothetical protein E2C06_36110 [Dankookia rubra]|uniref:Polysaccharide biosynthesis protein C-terminal domain-containing protein n=1 Tax=Dankookia rubra TaxID=1442381 RepID=A0A4R5Q2M9_9PROT|nr:hypothetical protein [Dankookia rubra]TDH57124.1 hypothetical protein E2C06_36110 [Dankookia rubra]
MDEGPDENAFYKQVVSRKYLISTVRRFAPSVFVVISQSFFHFGTFVSNMFLIRGLEPESFGSYAIIMGLLLYAMNLYFALVIYPLTLHLAAIGANAADLLGSGIVTGLAFSLPLGVLVLIAGLLVSDAVTAILAACALIIWHAQFAVSRILLIQQRYISAAVGDAIASLGMAAGLIICFSFESLSVRTPFLILIFTASLAFIFQGRQCNLRLQNLYINGVLFGQLWRIGRFALFGMFGEGIAAQLLIWALLLTHGKPAVAAYVAMRSLVGFSQPITSSVVSLVVPAVARSRSQADVRKSVIDGVVIAVPLILASFCIFLILAVFAAPLVQFFYGTDKGYTEGIELLRLLAFFSTVHVLAECCSGILRGLQRVQIEAKAQLVSSGAGILVGLPLVALMGPIGGAFLTGVAATCRFFLGLLAITNTLRDKTGSRTPFAKG